MFLERDNDGDVLVCSFEFNNFVKNVALFISNLSFSSSLFNSKNKRMFSFINNDSFIIVVIYVDIFDLIKGIVSIIDVWLYVLSFGNKSNEGNFEYN